MPKLSSHGNMGEDVPPLATLDGLDELHALKSIVEAAPTVETLTAIQRLFQEPAFRIVRALGSEWLRANMVPTQFDWNPRARSSRTKAKAQHVERAPWPPMVRDADLASLCERGIEMLAARRAWRKPAVDPRLQLFQDSINAVHRHKATSQANVSLGPAAADHHVVFDRARQPLFCPCHAHFVPCLLVETGTEGRVWAEAVCTAEPRHRFPPLYDKESWRGFLMERPRCTGCESRETYDLGEHEITLRAQVLGCAKCDYPTLLPAPRVPPPKTKMHGTPAEKREWLKRTLSAAGVPDLDKLRREHGIPTTLSALAGKDGIVDPVRLELFRVRCFMQHVGRQKLVNRKGRQPPMFRVYLRARLYQDILQGFVQDASVYAAWARDYLSMKPKASWQEGTQAVHWAQYNFPHVGTRAKRRRYDEERAWLWEQFRKDAAAGPLPTTTHYEQTMREQFPTWTNTHLSNVVVTERRRFLEENPGVTTITQLNDQARARSGRRR